VRDLSFSQCDAISAQKAVDEIIFGHCASMVAHFLTENFVETDIMLELQHPDVLKKLAQ
jgi:hypothetical protein